MKLRNEFIEKILKNLRDIPRRILEKLLNERLEKYLMKFQEYFKLNSTLLTPIYTFFKEYLRHSKRKTIFGSIFKDYMVEFPKEFLILEKTSKGILEESSGGTL